MKDNIPAAGGGAIVPATLVVAASNSLDKKRADYICDGTSDEVEINQAIADLPINGGSIYLLEGTYTIDGTININKSNVFLFGAGKSTKITTATDDINLITIIGTLGNEIEYTTITDLWLYGTGTGKGNGIVLDYAPHTTIQNCIIENNGTYVAPHLNSNGIFLYTKCDYSKFFGNYILSNGEFGIYFDGGNDYVIVQNNYINDNLEGIYVWSGCDYGIIKGNICQNNSYRGIAVTCVSNGTIISENIVRDSYYGIWASYDTSSIMVINNIIQDTTYPLYIFHPSIIVYGNRIQPATNPNRVYLAEEGTLVLSDHFNSDIIDSGRWAITTSGTATITSDPAGTGKLKLSTGATINSEAIIESYIKGRIDQYVFSPIVFKEVILNSQSNVELEMGLYYDPNNYVLITRLNDTQVRVIANKAGVATTKDYTIDLTSSHDFALGIASIPTSYQQFYRDNFNEQIGTNKAPLNVPLRAYVRLKTLANADKNLEIDAIEYRTITNKS